MFEHITSEYMTSLLAFFQSSMLLNHNLIFPVKDELMKVFIVI